MSRLYSFPPCEEDEWDCTDGYMRCDLPVMS